MSRRRSMASPGSWWRGVVAVSALAILGACTTADTGNGDDASTGSDATVQQDAATGQDAAPDVDADTCPTPPNPGPSGMNGGRDCQNCHSNFTVAGTLYESITGGAPVPSATVRITDANSQVLELVTGFDGNFYTTQSLNFPVSIEIEKCPDTVSMPSTASTGACNSCHDNTNRVHLP